MNWLETLLFGNSVAHAVLLYAAVIVVGIALGKLKIFGVSLGVTFVLFAGLVVGHFGYLGLTVDHTTLEFVREFGLILFVYSIGLQVGPSFFSSFKRGGMTLNLLAVLIVLLNVAVAGVVYWAASGRIEVPMLVGILSGAVTNTPGLGAAQQALMQLQEAGRIAEIPEIALGYAVAYPLGVVGIILAMLLIRYLFRIRMEREARQFESEQEAATARPNCFTLRVENPQVFGKTIREVAGLIGRTFVASRILKGDVVQKVNDDTVLEKDDRLLVVTTSSDEAAVRTFIGPEIPMDWDRTAGPLVSRRIVITKSEINGKSIGSLHLRTTYNLNATRVNRSGVDLLAAPGLVLQIGDRITVVGELDNINRLGAKLGNSLKRLHEPNMITLFVGILLGIVVGSIPFAFPGMPMPVKLGLAGGPLVVAILIGRFGYKIHLVTYTSTSASLLLRELGISLFLASVGIGAGRNFLQTVISEDGLLWIGSGFLITVVPLLIVGALGRWRCKLNYFTLMGLLAGSTTDPPALAYSNRVADNDAPAVAYSTVYPLTMFLRVITAQLIILAFV